MSLASSERKFAFKLDEFLQEKNLEKYNKHNKILKFKDGTYMGLWFNSNKKKIFESTDEKCKKVLEQYKQYKDQKMSKEESSLSKKIKEFIEEENLEKFKSNNKTLKFKDGTYKSSWFNHNKKEIFESNDEKCKKVQEQYKQYNDQKLKEFIEEENLEKFKSNNRTLKFEDGTYKSSWFNHNKKEIFESNDEKYKGIQNQYKKYSKLTEETVFEERHKSRIKEFCEDKNLEKFDHNKKNLRFRDGGLKGVWFNNNRKRILESNDEKYKEIQEQYKKYRKLIEKKTFEERHKSKIKEFCEEENLEKFKSNNKTLRFKNGTYMGRWFNNNKLFIINSDDEKCIEILKQFYEYKNKPDMINYIDEKIKSKTLIKK